MVLGAILCLSGRVFADGSMDNPENGKDSARVSTSDKKNNPYVLFSAIDSLSFSRRFIHRLGLEFRPAYIFATNSFLRGENIYGQPYRNSYSAHLKYSLQFHQYTYADRIYGGAYQGIGLAYYSFGDRQYLGEPITFYLFQGARIARLSRSVSFNYEWNFGLSFGWKPYHYDTNPYNKVIGSRTNAYINTNFYLNWMLSPRWDLNTGITLTHFSNGNTRLPNAGVNTVGWKLGLVYNFNRKEDYLHQPLYLPPIPAFPRHFSYDLVLFGSWRRKGFILENSQIASPDAYVVAGFSFAAMYNLGYKFRLGLAVDGVYDGSANVNTEDYIIGTTQSFSKPPFSKQLALGFSGRFEYIMPYFTVGIGMGTNVLHGGGDLKAFYQLLALKIEVTRNSFVHIGYNIQNFQTPNFLMLGIGYRFNNKYPLIHR